MKKTLTKASSKKSKKKSSKEELPTFPLRRPRLSKPAGPRPRPIKYITKKNGELETKEERKDRLARRAALTLKVFQAAYDDYHNR